MRVVAIIPARYQSTRFPGKPLAKETGKYLIQHVYERVCQAAQIEQVIVATDDERIGRAVQEFDGCWAMTRSDHPSGTDRIAEVVREMDADLVVNVQGDEPEIDPGHIDAAIEALRTDEQAHIATLIARCENLDQVNNPNVVKAVVDGRHHALYFSRAAIPHVRSGLIEARQYFKHLGLYVYRREALLQMSAWSPTPLEQAECLEQLRALEHGLIIATRLIDHAAVGIDTPEQYAAFVDRCRQKPNS